MNREFGLAPSESPILPPLRARGLAVLLNPDADVRDFLTVIEGDPGLTASVLRASNSAFSAPREPIASARDAIVRIGLDASRQITSAAIMRAQFEHVEDSGLNVDAFWRRQLAVGLLTEASALQDRLPPEGARSAFTAGLLHRIGRLALAARSSDRYHLVVESVRGGAAPLEAEQEFCGADAVLITRHVAIRWSLPDTIANALTRQDDPEAVGSPRLMHEAIEVAEALGFDEGFSEEVVAPASLSDDHPRAEQLDAIGGGDELRQRVDWFRHASDAHEAMTPEVGDEPRAKKTWPPVAPADRRAA